MNLSLISDLNTKIPIELKEINLCLQELLFLIDKQEFLNHSLTIKFISSKSMKELNFKFRNIDKLTNVLAFAEFDYKEPSLNNYLGDIAICLSVVKKEAKIKSIELSNHLLHVIIHGTLHLLGYDHQDNVLAQKMESLEIQVLNKFKIASPPNQ